MAALLPTILSDDEENEISVHSQSKTTARVDRDDGEKNDEEDEAMEGSFEFGGALGEDGEGIVNFGFENATDWSYKSALRLLEKNDTSSGPKPERTAVANIIAAARTNMKKKGIKGNVNDKQDDDISTASSSAISGNDSDNDTDIDGDEAGDSDTRSDSDSEPDSDDEVDDAYAAKGMEGDVLKERMRHGKGKKTNHQEKRRGNDEDSDSDEESVESSASEVEGGEDELDEEAQAEAERAAAYFETITAAADTSEGTAFAQLNVSRPLLRGVADMGFVTPTPIQESVIPVALAGRDVCASAVTGSGKTAAFLLPVMERILQRGGGRMKGKGGGGSSGAAATRALILTPTRELAAQCVSMMAAIGKYTSLRAALVVGGAKNLASQAAELRTRPDVVVATPGRLLDHVTNSPGVDLDDLEFLILDEADRLLDLGFQDETHEIVKSCPIERQTLLFSATMGTSVDDLIKLSLKRPVRVRVSDRKGRRGTSASGDGSDHGPTGAAVEVAHRLEQEFVRVRTGNEGVNREGMLLSLLTRTFKSRSIVFFETKALAHRLMIICGLCGIKCAELHGNLTQTQRLEALEAFREGEVDILLATDLAARGLDISGVEAVINFEMPSQVETYVHRIGRTARAGRGGSSCTLIGEGRRYLMKEVIKDAEEKRRKAGNARDKKSARASSGIIRSRTIPPAVVAHFVAKISSLEPHIEEVLTAEAVAKMDRIAEMEAMRARNIIEHSAEIKARPQREWFASTKQKQSSKEAAAEKQRLIAEKVGTGKHRMTRKKRRAREAKEEALQMQEEMRQEQEEAGKKPAKLVTSESMKLSAKASKREQARMEKVRANKSLGDEDRERELRQKRQEAKKGGKKQRGAFASDAMGDSSLFAEEKVSYGQKGGKTQEQEREIAKSRYQFTEFDPNMKKRKGGKKGHNAFKSKKKYKRR